MSPVSKVFVVLGLICPLTLSAECGAEGSCDETSLVQVKHSVKRGNERANGDAEAKAKFLPEDQFGTLGDDLTDFDGAGALNGALNAARLADADHTAEVEDVRNFVGDEGIRAGDLDTDAADLLKSSNTLNGNNLNTYSTGKLVSEQDDAAAARYYVANTQRANAERAIAEKNAEQVANADLIADARAMANERAYEYATARKEANEVAAAHDQQWSDDAATIDANTHADDAMYEKAEQSAYADAVRTATAEKVAEATDAANAVRNAAKVASAEKAATARAEAIADAMRNAAQAKEQNEAKAFGDSSIGRLEELCLR
jgi:hypothetical protein